jgi:hypothetical protein
MACSCAPCKHNEGHHAAPRNAAQHGMIPQHALETTMPTTGPPRTTHLAHADVCAVCNAVLSERESVAPSGLRAQLRE